MIGYGVQLSLMFRDVVLMIDLKLMVWTVPGKSGINGSMYNFECRDNEELRDNDKMLKKRFIYNLLVAWCVRKQTQPQI